MQCNDFFISLIDLILIDWQKIKHIVKNIYECIISSFPILRDDSHKDCGLKLMLMVVIVFVSQL